MQNREERKEILKLLKDKKSLELLDLSFNQIGFFEKIEFSSQEYGFKHCDLRDEVIGKSEKRIGNTSFLGVLGE